MFLEQRPCCSAPSIPHGMEDSIMGKPKIEKKVEAKSAKKQPKAKEEGLVVFAFRLTEAERDAIHKTAGPARASRFVRSIAVAAARDDVDAIKTLIRDALQAAQ